MTILSYIILVILLGIVAILGYHVGRMIHNEWMLWQMTRTIKRIDHHIAQTEERIKKNKEMK